MTLLRASSEAIGLEVDIDVAVDPGSEAPTGIPGGRQLLAFASAAQYPGPDVADARRQLEAVVGTDGMLEAAATVAVFNGLVRVADGTGIQLDAGVLQDSADYRERLGINKYGGAASSEATRPGSSVDRTSVRGFFR